MRNLLVLVLATSLLSASEAKTPEPRPLRMRDKVLLVGQIALCSAALFYGIPWVFGKEQCTVIIMHKEMLVDPVARYATMALGSPTGKAASMHYAYEAAKSVAQAITPTIEEELEQTRWELRQAELECEEARQEFLRSRREDN